MALDSTSTLDDALAQYNDNLNWEGDITAAKAALAAARWIIANRGKRIAINDRSVDYESISEEKQRLQNYVDKLDTSINRCSFVRGHALL